jgi:hypothetical protein
VRGRIKRREVKLRFDKEVGIRRSEFRGGEGMRGPAEDAQQSAPALGNVQVDFVGVAIRAERPRAQPHGLQLGEAEVGREGRIILFPHGQRRLIARDRGNVGREVVAELGEVAVDIDVNEHLAALPHMIAHRAVVGTFPGRRIGQQQSGKDQAQSEEKAGAAHHVTPLRCGKLRRSSAKTPVVQFLRLFESRARRACSGFGNRDRGRLTSSEKRGPAGSASPLASARASQQTHRACLSLSHSPNASAPICMRPSGVSAMAIASAAPNTCAKAA